MKSVELTITKTTSEVPFAVKPGDWRFVLQGLGGNQLDLSQLVADAPGGSEVKHTFTDVPGGDYVARCSRVDVDGNDLGMVAETPFTFTEDPEFKSVETAGALSVRVL